MCLGVNGAFSNKVFPSLKLSQVYFESGSVRSLLLRAKTFSLTLHSKSLPFPMFSPSPLKIKALQKVLHSDARKEPVSQWFLKEPYSLQFRNILMKHLQYYECMSGLTAVNSMGMLTWKINSKFNFIAYMLPFHSFADLKVFSIMLWKWNASPKKS